jgi:hypothetical protein
MTEGFQIRVWAFQAEKMGKGGIYERSGCIFGQKSIDVTLQSIEFGWARFKSIFVLILLFRYFDCCVRENLHIACM